MMALVQKTTTHFTASRETLTKITNDILSFPLVDFLSNMAFDWSATALFINMNLNIEC